MRRGSGGRGRVVDAGLDWSRIIQSDSRRQPGPQIITCVERAKDTGTDPVILAWQAEEPLLQSVLDDIRSLHEQFGEVLPDRATADAPPDLSSVTCDEGRADQAQCVVDAPSDLSGEIDSMRPTTLPSTPSRDRMGAERGPVSSSRITVLIVGVAFVDLMFISRTIHDPGGFVFHLVVLVLLGACGGAVLAPMTVPRTERKDSSKGVGDERRWVWLLPLAIILCEVAWGVSSVVVGMNWKSVFPAPQEVFVKYNGTIFYDLTTAEFQAWLDRRWYAELFSGLIVGSIVAATVVGSGQRSRPST